MPHTQRISLSVESVVTIVDSCFYDLFFPAQWKDCVKVDLVEAQPKVAKETGCFHITQDIPLIFFFFFWELSL